MEDTQILISKREKKYFSNIQKLSNAIFLRLQSKVTPFEMISLSNEVLQEKMYLTKAELLIVTGKVFGFNANSYGGNRKAQAIFDGNSDSTSLYSKYKFSLEIKEKLVKKVLCYANSTKIDEPSLLHYHIDAIPSVRQSYICKAIRIETEKCFRKGDISSANIKKNIQAFFSLNMFDVNHRQLWDSQIEYDFQKIYKALKYQKKNLLD